MEKAFNKIQIILLGLLLSINPLSGQNNSLHSPGKSIKLDGKTEVKEITLPLRDSLDYVSIKVWALVLSGDLSVEIFDPLGVKHGNFSLEGQMDATTTAKLKRGDVIIGDEQASGNLFRTIMNPPIGAWKAKIVTKKAVGTISFEFTTEVVTYKIYNPSF